MINKQSNRVEGHHIIAKPFIPARVARHDVIRRGSRGIEIVLRGLTEELALRDLKKAKRFF